VIVSFASQLGGRSEGAVCFGKVEIFFVVLAHTFKCISSAGCCFVLRMRIDVVGMRFF
jgi:hypothetical protein